MTLPEYLSEFINIKPQDDQVEIYFNDLIWDGHTPVSNEVLLYQIPLAKWEKDKEKYISRILNNKKYFRICGLCGEVNHSGHMHDAFICQGCAWEYHQVVY
jgi:hypothetical protein